MTGLGSSYVTVLILIEGNKNILFKKGTLANDLFKYLEIILETRL